jgi:hypothetical protein
MLMHVTVYRGALGMNEIFPSFSLTNKKLSLVLQSTSNTRIYCNNVHKAEYLHFSLLTISNTYSPKLMTLNKLCIASTTVSTRISSV